ncbi:hypothetical protein EIP91_006851 [Steccherinum ochraceum]|uniref:Transmembrane protein n=1 Tax=Steccherinum ochraceum TaxID=92696 RepID=A0A4R0RPI5_9APHY|nr:hypothetical protein EIP91_006851 [Steccherinum ochraceum]
MQILFAASLIALAYKWPLAQAQSTNATCIGGMGWTFNNRTQSPCLVAAYLMGACEADGEWTVTALKNLTTTYGPLTVDQADLCTCSSVTYSMVSACAYCQSGPIPVWADWITECPAAVLTNGSYFHVVPSGTSVPSWAFLPISPTGSGSWNAAIAETYSENHPDSSPSPSSSGSSPSNTSSPPAPSPASKKSNTGAIVGGAVGGVVGLILICAAAFFFWRRYSHRRSMAAPSAAYLASASNTLGSSPSPRPDEKHSPLNSAHSPTFPESQPMLAPYPPPNLTPMKVYNPDNPSTFPDAYQYPLSGYNQGVRPDSGYNATSGPGHVAVYTPGHPGEV